MEEQEAGRAGDWKRRRLDEKEAGREGGWKSRRLEKQEAGRARGWKKATLPREVEEGAAGGYWKWVLLCKLARRDESLRKTTPGTGTPGLLHRGLNTPFRPPGAAFGGSLLFFGNKLHDGITR